MAALKRAKKTLVLTRRTPVWSHSSRNLHLIVGPGLKPWNIDVTTTSGGVVELGGEVDRAEDKAEAVRIARDTEGLTRVEDHLRVR